MDVKYKKDLHHNYMVITVTENSRAESYFIKLLSFSSMKGLLSVERKTIDNQVLFYYDISAKQSIINLYDKTVLSYEKVKQLILRMILTIEKAYDFLLMEDDFVISPEFVYMDVAKEIPYLCYLPGYQMNIKTQISGFIEFIMNKVDYNDKEAVLLVYSLYAVTKEEGFTFDHLHNALHIQNQPIQTEKRKVSVEAALTQEQTVEKNKGKNQEKEEKKKSRPNIPVMMEKLVGEKEISCYPPRTYIYTVLCILGGALVLIGSIATKILYNSFGNQVDYSKLFALILIVSCVDGYILKRIWNKKNQITKIVTKQEYINPGKESDNISVQSIHQAVIGKSKLEISSNLKELSGDEELTGKKDKVPVKINRDNKCQDQASNPFITHIKEEELEEDNPTCILNESTELVSYVLKPIDTTKYDSIIIDQFPFFIGKLKKNVDYCLEKDVVSRYHAKITLEQEHYYITDLNSTNGTFLNKEPLQTYQKQELKLGDEIAFANIKFLFLTQEEG